ncbi:MAG: dihydrodipicolinate synthase family protein [Ignisphaera sp.]|nr:dihydrodipicolinate synthase family protein [Ignisphaera sp.]MCX8168385.1 dihydrodipicolinate synthase family protein [Ignisphaera sp.]MDW8085783.1 dihydrodipicolinate synthase family protein [Ignisphaera sp.]
MRFKVEGILTALLTPLTRDGDLCVECLESLIKFQIGKGISALFLTGTYGEGVILSSTVKQKIYKYALEFSSSKLTLLPHVGGADLESITSVAKFASDLGYSVVSVVGPIYHKPTKRGLAEFFSHISSKADVDIVIYNNRGRQGYNISPDDFDYISREVPAVVGIKDTSYDIEQMIEYVKRFGAKYFIGGAGDNLLYVTFAIGMPAHICGMSNAFPEIAIELYRAVKNGDHNAALDLQYKITRIRKVLAKFNLETQELLREVLKFRGLNPGYPPIQMREGLEARQTEELRRSLEQIVGEYLVR